MASAKTGKVLSHVLLGIAAIFFILSNLHKEFLLPRNDLEGIAMIFFGFSMIVGPYSKWRVKETFNSGRFSCSYEQEPKTYAQAVFACICFGVLFLASGLVELTGVINT